MSPKYKEHKKGERQAVHMQYLPFGARLNKGVFMGTQLNRGFHRLYGKISANRFDRYKNDVFPLLDVLNSHTTE